MTESEAKELIRQIGIFFPAVDESLRFASEGGAATIKAWASLLQNYSSEEAYAVFEGWKTRVLDKFYLKQPIQNMIAEINKRRDQAARTQEFDDERKAFYKHRNDDDRPFSVDGDALAAIAEGQKVHRRYLDEQMTRYEYELQRDVILEKHGII